MHKSSSTSTKLHHLCLVAAALCATPLVSAAQGVNLTLGLTDFTTWSLFGTATALNETPGNGFTYSTLRLTFPGTGGSAGAGFAPDAIVVDVNQSFTFDFSFFIPQNAGTRGDGFTFTLAGAPAVGFGGSSLGYGGLPANSIAFAVDTFNFSGEPISPSIQILQGGAITPLAFVETGLGDTIEDLDFQWRGTVIYTPSGNDDEMGALNGTITHLNLGTFSVSADVDLSGLGNSVSGGHEVFFGFTAGNGLADDGHFITTAAPVPLPAAFWLLGSALAAVGVSRRRKS